MSSGDKINWIKIETLRGMVDQHVGFLVDDYSLKPLIAEWLMANCVGQWNFDYFYGSSILFQFERDAAMFKLVWYGA